jgi:hypothetical protein
MASVYEPIDPISKAEAEHALVRNNPDELWRLIIAVGLHEPDAAWAESCCVRLSSHPHDNVRGNAVLSFGHLARRFGRLDESTVRPIVEAALRDRVQYVRGQAWAAADDIIHYLGWDLPLP